MHEEECLEIIDSLLSDDNISVQRTLLSLYESAHEVPSPLKCEVLSALVSVLNKYTDNEPADNKAVLCKCKIALSKLYDRQYIRTLLRLLDSSKPLVRVTVLDTILQEGNCASEGDRVIATMIVNVSEMVVFTITVDKNYHVGVLISSTDGRHAWYEYQNVSAFSIEMPRLSAAADIKDTEDIERLLPLL